MNAQRLVTARKARRVSQQELGEALGINPEQAIGRISRYERGVSTPAYKIVRQIAKILNMPSWYFYTEDDDFAEEVLILYRENNPNRLLITKLQEQIRAQESQEHTDALKEIQKIISSLKNL
ncbi:helix-turn-helix domain-containing protein [Xenorhabdus bovienii]|uniref:helix-turn-helix domain-containing protein n=1 Tax=Xenorhabdus bovienii TaxID=40576 RepID=UPI001EDF8919|nr:helix-turn-helix transcriptional regulator [Xenorhabdus bovienii]MCG3462225.1 helix-turn-helix domain-containing protein [Xenorhabdus bovienii]